MINNALNKTSKQASFLLAGLIALGAACSAPAKKEAEEETQEVVEAPAEKTNFHPSEGSIEVIDESLKELINTEAGIEVLAGGFKWTEGPEWIEDGQYLLFCDIPQNTIFKWKEGDSTSVYLTPSGYTGTGDEERREPGSNGLMLNAEGQLLLCQHGDRRIAIMDADLSNPSPNYITVADNFDGKKLDSPNDLDIHSNGDIYFTDPPYGLPQQHNDPTKEMDFQGAYRWSAQDGTVSLLCDSLTRPNGVTLSLDEKQAYVANSDPEKSVWMVFDIEEDGSFANGRLFYDSSPEVGKAPGLNDGMDIDANGNLFATGPGGVWIFSPEGKLLGKIKTGQPTANCTFSDDYQYLYITANSYLVRVKIR